MKEPDEAQSSDEASEASDDGFDSVLRAVAHVSTVDMPSPVLGPGAEPIDQSDFQEPVPAPKPGDVLDGRYKLDTLLGAGGMGAVYSARNLRTEKEVAIKVLLPQHGGQKLKRERVVRFVREARAAGRIRHPNVVDVYDVEGETDTPYIVMERLHGESLWARIKRGPIPPREAVEILLAAMRGVAEAHRQGVIHRDLKPDNIFLAREGEGGEAIPKVLDFGVSRMLARESSDDRRPTTITRTGYVVGTPSYMPLEQLRGDPNVDARADVYALGVILYECLSGARPFEAQNDHDLVIRMVTEKPTPLRLRASGLDNTLEGIVMRALAKDPDARFKDVECFARALTSWNAGDLEGAREESERGLPRVITERVPAPRKSRGPAVMVALVMALGVALAIAFALRSSPAEAPAKVTPVPAREQPQPAKVTAAPSETRVEPVAPTPPVVEPAETPPETRRSTRPGKRAITKKPREDRATELLEQDF